VGHRKPCGGFIELGLTRLGLGWPVAFRPGRRITRNAYRICESEFLGFDAMRNAAQFVGCILIGKTDWGLMIFTDKVCV